ncbi:MAG: mandelate racemase/muconate lactonizing enzyme family protein [Geminicoccaceae bacterium]
MKITDLETFVVGNPPPSFGGRYWIFVKLTTDGGTVGYGEVYSLPFAPHVVEAMIGDVADRFLIGEDPHHIERFWRRAYGAGYTLRPDISIMGIVSGLETACWDIIGKEAGKPVHELLGGRVHERLRAYTYLYPEESDPEPGEGSHVYTDPDLAAARALAYVDSGFTAVKFDPVGGYSVFDPRQLSLEALRRSERFVQEIREAVGDRADLLFGTHGQLTPSGAIRLAKRLEPFDPLWFEEPVPPEKPEDMAKVARQTSIPVATGERLATKYEFSRVLETVAASILQPALGRVGGLLEAKKIAGMAEAHYAQIAPHLYCGPIEAAANIQLAACSPNFLILECIRDFSGFHADILETPLRCEDGHVIPSAEPGIGVSLDEEVARAHPYDGKPLHLEMEQHPL